MCNHKNSNSLWKPVFYWTKFYWANFTILHFEKKSYFDFSLLVLDLCNVFLPKKLPILFCWNIIPHTFRGLVTFPSVKFSAISKYRTSKWNFKSEAQEGIFFLYLKEFPISSCRIQEGFQNCLSFLKGKNFVYWMHSSVQQYTLSLCDSNQF